MTKYEEIKFDDGTSFDEVIDALKGYKKKGDYNKYVNFNGHKIYVVFANKKECCKEVIGVSRSTYNKNREKYKEQATLKNPVTEKEENKTKTTSKKASTTNTSKKTSSSKTKKNTSKKTTTTKSAGKKTSSSKTKERSENDNPIIEEAKEIKENLENTEVNNIIDEIPMNNIINNVEDNQIKPIPNSDLKTLKVNFNDNMIEDLNIQIMINNNYFIGYNNANETGVIGTIDNNSIYCIELNDKYFNILCKIDNKWIYCVKDNTEINAEYIYKIYENINSVDITDSYEPDKNTCSILKSARNTLTYNLNSLKYYLEECNRNEEQYEFYQDFIKNPFLDSEIELKLEK